MCCSHTLVFFYCSCIYILVLCSSLCNFWLILFSVLLIWECTLVSHVFHDLDISWIIKCCILLRNTIRYAQSWQNQRFTFIKQPKVCYYFSKLYYKFTSHQSGLTSYCVYWIHSVQFKHQIHGILKWGRKSWILLICIHELKVGLRALEMWQLWS